MFKTGLQRLPEVDADLPEVNLKANSEAILSEIRMTYSQKYIENEPPAMLAAESAVPDNEPEKNVALKLNKASIAKSILGRRAPAISCW